MSTKCNDKLIRTYNVNIIECDDKNKSYLAARYSNTPPPRDVWVVPVLHVRVIITGSLHDVVLCCSTLQSLALDDISRVCNYSCITTIIYTISNLIFSL